MSKDQRKALLDKIFGKLISRKFQVWIVCTVALFLEQMSGSEYLWISGIYMGLESVLDLGVLLKAKAGGQQSGTNYEPEGFSP